MLFGLFFYKFLKTFSSPGLLYSGHRNLKKNVFLKLCYLDVSENSELIELYFFLEIFEKFSKTRTQNFLSPGHRIFFFLLFWNYVIRTFQKILS